jgi:type IV secretory pathway TrbF-like protein
VFKSPLQRRAADPKDSEKAVMAAFERDMPEAAFLQARREYLEATGPAAVDRARLFVAVVLVSIVAIAEGIALWALIPLKTTEPYVIPVDSKGNIGKQAVEVQRAAEYTPERPVLERELYEFVERLYAINADYPKVVQDGHIKAYAYTRGRAITEWKDFLAREQPYQRQAAHQGLIRTVEHRTTSFREDGRLVLIRFATLERSTDRPVPITREWLMTLQFVRQQPKDEVELRRNPLGIYITHFEIVEER